MKVALIAALLSSLAVHQAAAQYGWGNAKAFSNPYNTDNQCSQDQKSGFDWSGLKTGDFGAFGGFDFSGFSCKDSFSKRSLTKRTGIQDKCVEGSVSKSDSGPKISCGSGDKFSINEMQVSVSYDTDLDFIYDMPDGSTCKHTSSCSAGGSAVKNTQCGGAQSVTFQLPTHSDKDSCDIGIHSINFDCSPGTTSTTAESSSTTAAASSTTSAVTATTSSSAVVEASSTTSSTTTTTSAAESSTTSAVVETTTAAASITTGSSSVAATSTTSDTAVLLTTSTVFSTSTATVTSCGPEVISCPARSTVVVTSIIAVSTTICPVSQVSQIGGSSESSSSALPAGTTTTSAPESTTAAASSTSELSSTTAAASSTTAAPQSSTTSAPGEAITTEVVYTTVTTCPVIATVTSGGSTLVQTTSTVSTLTLTSTATVCPSCTAAPPPPPPPSPESTTAAPPPPASSSPPPSPPPPAGCPQVLPSCLNSFLSQYVPSCTSNSDSSCFCPSSNFTNAVMQCIQSWGVSPQEVQAAMSYFTGICANHVGQNPGIITAVPSTITLIPAPSTYTVTATAAGSAPPPPPAPMPVTTISIESTVTISSTLTSVYTTAVTVPQVQFITTAAPAPPGETNAAAPTAVGSVVVVQTTQVGLIPGTTTYAPAAASAEVVPAAASTFGTSIVAAPTGGNLTAATTSSSPFAAFTGAASKHNVGMGMAGVAMVAMAIAL